jgi:hypothetical protein
MQRIFPEQQRSALKHERRKTMNRVLSTTIAALFAAGASGVALAEKPVQDQSVNPASASTTATDTTTDDTYTHGETVRQAAQDARTQTDQNRGELVREAAHTQRDFMKFDTDNNGSLSTAELSADTELTSNFSTLDENGDGILSRAEFDGHLQLGDTDDTVEDEE